MSSYLELKQQADEMARRAEEARQLEVRDVIRRIHEMMREYNISAADLGFGSTTSTRGRSKGAAKYRDPASSKEWTGRGRAPTWIIEAENQGRSRDEFLI